MTPSHVAVIAIGVLLIIMGGLLIQRKRMNIPIGGMGGIRPLFTIPLRGIGALIFGISGVLCGIAVIGFVLFALTDVGKTAWVNANLILQIIVIGGLLVGFGVGFIMQILMFILDGISKHRKGN